MGRKRAAGQLANQGRLWLGSAVQRVGAESAVTLNLRGVVLAEIDGQACDMNQAGRRGVSSGECWMAMR